MTTYQLNYRFDLDWISIGYLFGS